MINLSAGGTGCTLKKSFSDGRVERMRIQIGIYLAATKKKMHVKRNGHITTLHSYINMITELQVSLTKQWVCVSSCL